MGYNSQNQVDNAEDLSAPGGIMANPTGVVVVLAGYLDIINSLEKMINDFTLLPGFGSLVEFNRDGSCIAHLVQF
jgi:hypothetical protein